jgi:hypothetical protein
MVVSRKLRTSTCACTDILPVILTAMIQPVVVTFAWMILKVMKYTRNVVAVANQRTMNVTPKAREYTFVIIQPK